MRPRGRAEPVALRAPEAPGPKEVVTQEQRQGRLGAGSGIPGEKRIEGRTFGPTEPDASEGLREHGGVVRRTSGRAPLQQSSGGRRQIAVGWEGGSQRGWEADHRSWDSSVHEKTVV